MDGINPTLAFAALLFGLSGNPQDTTHQSAMNTQSQERAGCTAAAGVGDPAQLSLGADPLARRSVPAASTAPALDPCEPVR